MNNLEKGDGLLLFNGNRVIVTGSVFKMNSIDPNYYCVPISLGHDEFELYVDVRGIVEIWRDGELIGGKVDIEQVSQQAKSYHITIKPKPDDLYALPLFRNLTR